MTCFVTIYVSKHRFSDICGFGSKNYGPFPNSMSYINNTQIDNAKDKDVGMPAYNLI